MCGRGRRKTVKKKGSKDLEDGFGGWGGYMAAKRAKLIDQFHNDDVDKISDIFAGIKILVNGLTQPPAAELKKLMAAHGGEFHLYQVSSTTHIIASNLPNVKIKHLGAVPVVKPAWITESVALNKLLDYKRYLLYTNQSRLQPALNFPVVSKATSPSRDVDDTLSANDQPEFDGSKQISNLEMETDDDSKISKIVSKTINIASSSSSARMTKTASDPKFLQEFYNNSRLHLISTLGAEFKQLVSHLREKSNGKFPALERLITDKGNKSVTAPSSVIMHIDMDCFFVSVSLRNHPELKGLPVAITHAKRGVINSNDPKKQAIRDQEFALYQERLPEGAPSRVVDIKEQIDGLASMSEIASCSYEARKYGIKNGMFLGQAIKLCPELKTLSYDFEGYKEVSHVLYNTVASYTLDIEAVSCDEMYVDVKEILTDTGLSVEEWASHIRNEIMTKTGCPCSTGFGANKLQARLATRKAKPSGQYYLKPEEVETYMSEISLADVPGVGRVTLAKLNNLGYNTCGDIQNGSMKLLQNELGAKLGERIWEQAHGKDNKPLDFNHERKSVSAEINYGIRFKTEEEFYNFLRSLAIEVFNRLSDVNMKARGLTLKLLVRAEGAPVETAKFLGHGVCDAITKSSTANLIYSNAGIIYEEAKSIYDKLNVAFAELRGVGIQLSKLEKNSSINKTLSNFLAQGKSKISGPNESKTISTYNDADSIASGTKSARSIENVTSNTSNRPVKEMDKPDRSIASDKFPLNKSRGKGGHRGKPGKKSSSSRPIEALLGRAKVGEISKHDHKLENEAMRSKIDMDVLNELPEDIRQEVMKEYGFDSQLRASSSDQKPNVAGSYSHSSKSVEVSPKDMGRTNRTERTSSAYSPFANQSWAQIKRSIKTWTKSQKGPAKVDVDMLSEHVRQLAMDRKIELLQSEFNFLYRTFASLSCNWHEAYFSFVNAVQQGMVTRYGKILYVQTNFMCCQIK